MGTIHPLLPFSVRYNPQLDRTNYRQPNHVFVILGEENGRYVYFDTSSYKSAAFEPYPNNPELGWIPVETVDAVLREMFQLGYVEWQEDRRKALPTYADSLLARYVSGYENAEGVPCETPPGRLFQGREALLRLKIYLEDAQLNLAAPSWEYAFIEQGDLLSWKLNDLGKRRQLMAWWLEAKNRTQEAALWQQAGQAFQKLSLQLLYQREKGNFGKTKRYTPLIIQILEKEEEILHFFKNNA